ncbi:thialysine N-epsilon-acetyltransferase [Halyomorpha halys]|uniref:thialysine N-epsilon-acetyltransferase n=1 Tax=Halyomorpha halys TaxID=286706 RepID=UPI0006D519AF|nr:diamine acetyltransferase 2 [Halyomorpha halys]
MEELNVNIRQATKHDCPEIMRLIQELADFENMSDQVHLDAETLAKDGFETDNPSFKCLVIDDPENSGSSEAPKLIGYALYNIIYGTWEGKRMWLEDIMVMNKYRVKGIGKRLFSAVCKEALKENAKAVRFVALKWNPAMEFYKKFGTINLTETEEWQFSLLQHEDIVKAANLF